jgi:hypothetical protein
MSAVLDQTRTYRYELTREVEPHTEKAWTQPVTFIMLNPSTADETEDDPTIRKCMGYAARWGFRELVVVNLFAYRTSSPRTLKMAHAREVDIVGPLNGHFIMNAMHRSKWVVCAWGNNGTLMNKGVNTIKLLLANGITPRYLKVSKNKQPYHPLYLKWEQPLLEMDGDWEWRNDA